MSIIVLGTSSGAGKTTFAAMVCRYLHKKGIPVAPFKGSNLSTRHLKTSDGGMIGIGQMIQAVASGIEPSSDMNPVLIVPTENSIQYIVKGNVVSSKPEISALSDAIESSFMNIQRRYINIVCEGSGSPVELNIIDRDIANIGLMRITGIDAVLVADIERGGAFAALYGTWLLMPEDLRPKVKAFVINRFRGDRDILAPAIEKIESLTGMRCLGVLDYVRMSLPEEDCLSERCDRNDVGYILSSLDRLISDAEENGFDFDTLMDIIRPKRP